MLIVAQAVEQCQQVGRFRVCQLLHAHDVAHWVVGSVQCVVCQRIGVHVLVQFVVGSLLGQHADVLPVGVVVGFCMVHDVLQQRESLRHVLCQSVQTDGDGTLANVHAVVACQFVELLA